MTMTLKNQYFFITRAGTTGQIEQEGILEDKYNYNT